MFFTGAAENTFLCKVDTYLNFLSRKCSWEGGALKLWSLITPQPAFLKTTESEIFES